MAGTCGNCNRKSDAYDTGSGKTKWDCLFDGKMHREDDSCEHWRKWVGWSLQDRIADTNRYKDELETREQFQTSESSLERRHKEIIWTTWKVCGVGLAGTIIGIIIGYYLGNN